MSAALSAAAGAPGRGGGGGMAAFGARRMSWQRRVLFFGSIGAHVAAAIGLILYSIFHVEELAPPEVTLTFFNAPPPPPPPPPPKRSSGSKSTSTTKKTVITTSTIIQPVKPTDEKPSAPTEKEDKGSDDGVAGGVLGGVAGGVLGGVLGGTGPAVPQPQPAAAAPKMVASFTLNGERLSAPPPHLPEEYNNRHPHSTANGSYKMCVGTNGHVTEISVVRPIGSGVDDVIMNQIRNGWTYKPRPLPVCTMQNFVFNIP